MKTPRFKELRRTYGFDEVAIVPGDVTVNPDQVDIQLKIDKFTFDVPIIASAMDGVTDTRFVGLMGKAGGLAVLNLDGVQTRYKNPAEVLEAIAGAPISEVTPLMQKVYSQPVEDNLIGERVREIKKHGVICAVAAAPANTKRFAALAEEAGADIFFVQSTVTSARHISKSYHGLVFAEFTKQTKMPVVVGNCVSYTACYELMQSGIAGVLVGVGPGAACTSRQVLGVGVPQITATMDCALAREQFLKESGKYIPIITDGGMTNGGDICKAFAAGADAVMLGSIFAGTREAAGLGYHWGMSQPNAALPRGTRVKVGRNTTLEQVLFGPSSVVNGTQNLVGALRTAMGFCGARNMEEMHKTELVIAPAIVSEGKQLQHTQCY